LIAGLLTDLNISARRKEHYTQRLRHGLYYYYSRHYRPLDMLEQD
jgi:hypothetical protein